MLSVKGPQLNPYFLWERGQKFKEGKRKLAKKFNLSNRYTEADLISFNNKRLKEVISDIYPKELTIPKPQNLPQLYLISTCFSPEIRTT